MAFLQLSIFDLLWGPRSSKTRQRVKRRSSTNRGNDPQLYQLWQKIQLEYFPDRGDLLTYAVNWSTRRQKRTLASCNIKQRRIVVARELNHPPHYQWLEPLLYHEMCHAVLGMDVQNRNGKRQWHGAHFKNLERRHPAIAELDKWIKSGGWRFAVRSDRSRTAFRYRAS